MFVKQFSQSINTLLLGSEATAQCMVRILLLTQFLMNILKEHHILLRLRLSSNMANTLIAINYTMTGKKRPLNKML